MEAEKNNLRQVDTRTGLKEYDESRTPDQFGLDKGPGPSIVNTLIGRTDEFIDAPYISDANDEERNFNAIYGSIEIENNGENDRQPRKHKGGTVDDEDDLGVWHPDDGYPEPGKESEDGLRSMQNDKDESNETDHDASYDEGKP